MKTYTVLALATFAQAVGNVCLSKGMKEISSAGSLLTLFSQAVESPTIWIGTVLLLFFFLLFRFVRTILFITTVSNKILNSKAIDN